MKGPLYAMIFLGLVGYCCGGANRQCYSCVYVSSPLLASSSCEIPFGSALKATCNGQCKKVYNEVGSLITITRSCVARCIPKRCVKVGIATTCTACCDSHLCNGAGSVTFNLVATFSLIATAWGLSK